MRLILLTSIFLLAGAFATLASAQEFGQPCTANSNCSDWKQGSYCSQLVEECWPCEAGVLDLPFTCNKSSEHFLPGTCTHCGGSCDANNYCRK